MPTQTMAAGGDDSAPLEEDEAISRSLGLLYAKES